MKKRKFHLFQRTFLSKVLLSDNVLSLGDTEMNRINPKISTCLQSLGKPDKINHKHLNCTIGIMESSQGTRRRILNPALRVKDDFFVGMVPKLRCEGRVT